MPINKHSIKAWIMIISAMVPEMACDPRNGKEPETGSADTVLLSDMLELNDGQDKLAGIITAKPAYKKLGIRIECNGTLEAPPESIADVTAPVGGLVKSCPVHPGDYVSAGQLIVVLEHPDYLKIQQDYLETRSQWEYMKEEFKRQGELTVENAASVKTMQQAQTGFRTTEVRLVAMKSQLKMMGINADSLNIDNISSSINIYAPISGNVANIQINLGKYVDARQMVCEIINRNNLHLELLVYEKNIPLIKAGQPVDFSLTGNPDKVYKGHVRAISPKKEATNNAFSLHVHLEKSDPSFHPGMFVKAWIGLSEHFCLTLPAAAIISDDKEQVIYIREANLYRRVVVKTGIQSKDTVEILDYPPSLTDALVAISGAYYLNAAWHSQK
jgi:cobalt-zinc-cadmium efflux system membrane fusion protein